MNTKLTATADVGFPFASRGRVNGPPDKRSPVRLSHWLPLPFVLTVVLCTGLTSSSQAQATDPQQKLESLLRRYPDADANIYLSCSLPDGEPTSRGHLLHHPRHVQVIERRCKELGIPVTTVYAGDQTPRGKTEGAVEFLLRHIGLPVSGGN
jgi:hypothetical protein